MENLKKALLNILATIMQICLAYADGKINWGEWFKIAKTATGLVWIFKNLLAIKEDLNNATEAGINEMMADIKEEFDIPQDQLEETIEEALSILLLIFAMVGKRVPQLQVFAATRKKRDAVPV